ncbi:Lrp/AsnC family transcriptional regulator [Henriciella sp.]|uniref:Lrp/AsnC family transcriptional regulator n=1 Tax=Henriciella sp. TaxID=1968823 RepID=UPI00262AB653|nr:Lrp/AsnC family transcriptional regulator [Henriciella sp.]
MDATDKKLLRTHQSHPSMSMSELGEAIGLSHSACWKRLKRMEKDGYIDGPAILLNQNALGLTVTVIVQVKLEKNATKQLDEFERAIHDHPAILACFSMSGASDYMLRVVATSIEDYEVFLKEKLANLPHVSSLNSSFALKTIKSTTMLPV